MKTFLIASSIVLLAGCETETAFDKWMKVREPEAYQEVAIEYIDGEDRVSQWLIGIGGAESFKAKNIARRKAWQELGRSIAAWEEAKPELIKGWKADARPKAAKICNDQGVYE